MPAFAAYLTDANIGPTLAGFADLSPLGAGLCAFALMAVFAAGARALVRRTARREAWEMIARDRAIGRARDISATLTYRDALARQCAAS